MECVFCYSYYILHNTGCKTLRELYLYWFRLTSEKRYHRRITRNGSDIHIDYRRTTVEQEAIFSIWRNVVEFDPDEYQIFKYHCYVQKSYVPAPLRAPITTWEQTETFLLNILFVIFCSPLTFVGSFTQFLWQTL